MADYGFSRSFLGKVERILSTLTLAHSTSLAVCGLETPDSVSFCSCAWQVLTFIFMNAQERS